jgi:U3 small nucleolar RNA-associated protein 19
MSALMGAQGSKKRKKDANGTIDTTSLPSKRLAVEQDATATIQKLEDQIVESRKFYNNIATLLSMLNARTSKNEPNLTVAVALCRIFCRLIAGGDLKEQSRATEQEKIIVAWLKERCQEYQRALLDVIRQAEASFKVRK